MHYDVETKSTIVSLLWHLVIDVAKKGGNSGSECDVKILESITS